MMYAIVPPYLLSRIADAQPHLPTAAAAARHALSELEPLGRARAAGPRTPQAPSGAMAVAGSLRRLVSDAQNREVLPGVPARSEGDPAAGDLAVDEAYEGLGATYAFLDQAYGRSSLDGAGVALEATVHYGRAYDNAFWDGRRVVFGDGDGEVFNRFTGSLTVIAHELVHGLVQFAAPLEYRDQSGALNESLCDVFGVLVEQYRLRQEARSATWLVGTGLFTARVSGAALRSLRAPGTAYDDDVLGRDPQPGNMSGYVQTTSDNGGVHINSGIPNHAFYLVAERLGGFAWERAGQIWYDTLTEQQLPPDCSFRTFAAATVAAAEKRYGSGAAETTAVQAAWEAVNVMA